MVRGLRETHCIQARNRAVDLGRLLELFGPYSETSCSS